MSKETPAMPHIMVVEDDPVSRALLVGYFEKEGYRVSASDNADDLLQRVEQERIALVLLDIRLPGKDGLTLTRELRAASRVGIILVTARDDEIDRIVGLELGADDYVTKPFSVKELVARIHAVLRRPAGGETARRIVIGPLVIDGDKFEAAVDGAKVDLTATEFKILQLLAAKPGRVFTRDRILDHLWGDEKAVVDRTVDVHIRNLREKLGPAAALVKNIRGVGYKVEE